MRFPREGKVLARGVHLGMSRAGGAILTGDLSHSFAHSRARRSIAT